MARERLNWHSRTSIELVFEAVVTEKLQKIKCLSRTKNDTNKEVGVDHPSEFFAFLKTAKWTLNL